MSNKLSIRQRLRQEMGLVKRGEIVKREEDEIIEGVVIEDGENNKLVPSRGGRANFKSDLAEAAQQIDARTGQIKTYHDDYFPDPFLIKMEKERKEYEVRKQAQVEKEMKQLAAEQRKLLEQQKKQFEQQERKRLGVRPEHKAKLPKGYKATLLLPDGTTKEVNSKEEEEYYIQKYYPR